MRYFEGKMILLLSFFFEKDVNIKSIEGKARTPRVPETSDAGTAHEDTLPARGSWT